MKETELTHYKIQNMVGSDSLELVADIGLKSRLSQLPKKSRYLNGRYIPKNKTSDL